MYIYVYVYVYTLSFFDTENLMKFSSSYLQHKDKH